MNSPRCACHGRPMIRNGIAPSDRQKWRCHERIAELKRAGKCPGHPAADSAFGALYCQECLDSGGRRARKSDQRFRLKAMADRGLSMPPSILGTDYNLLDSGRTERPGCLCHDRPMIRNGRHPTGRRKWRCSPKQTARRVWDKTPAGRRSKARRNDRQQQRVYAIRAAAKRARLIEIGITGEAVLRIKSEKLPKTGHGPRRSVILL
jgi:hypothetical protein